MYYYFGELVKVIDGDTLKIKVDVGFRLTFTDNFRLTGIDAPEIRGEERPQGLKTKEALIDFFKNNGSQLLIESKKHGKYRWLATVYCSGINVNDWLVENGYAEVYEV